MAVFALISAILTGELTAKITAGYNTPKKQLAAMQRKIRKRRCEKGYDIEQKNTGYYDKAGQWRQQSLTPEQLKQFTDRELSLRMEGIGMRLRKDGMDRLEQAMKEIG